MTSAVLFRRSRMHSTRERTSRHRLYDDVDDESNSELSAVSLTNKCEILSNKDLVHSSMPLPTTSMNNTIVPLSNNEPSSNRFLHLCARLKRRFTLTRQHRARSEDFDGHKNKRHMLHIGNYKSFSAGPNDASNKFEWPDFEQIYDSIPHCLINALPGLDDFSFEVHDDPISSEDTETEEATCDAEEQTTQFQKCQRGGPFRRHAICRKIDKNQHRGQLTTFIQQLMIEKLMRTWT